MAPRNEGKIRKFICTTIRPTKLPYVELYEWEKCAKFIADFIDYEELPEPDKFPTQIPSPANVLQWQKGDCFDFSIALCSLLIGAGYDAYVVIGTAPKKITTKDESLMECPFSLEINDNEDRDDPMVDPDEHLMRLEDTKVLKPIEDFKVKQIENPTSHFDTEQASKKAKDDEIKHIKATVIDDDEPDYEKEDTYGKSRKHCWVYIQKPKRDI